MGSVDEPLEYSYMGPICTWGRSVYRTPICPRRYVSVRGGAPVPPRGRPGRGQPADRPEPQLEPDEQEHHLNRARAGDGHADAHVPERSAKRQRKDHEGDQVEPAHDHGGPRIAQRMERWHELADRGDGEDRFRPKPGS